MTAKKKIKRSLIIGLGGTGRDAILFAKHKILSIYDPENHKTVPPMIKFLVFDTTSPIHYTDKNGKETKLDTNSEFIRLAVKDAQAVIANQKFIKNAIPKENISKCRFIQDGAGQIRSLGRLAFLSNYQEIKAKIASTLKEIKNWKVSQNIDSEYETSDDSSLIVHIVFSASGGTGGGLFLDIANFFRQGDCELQETDKVFGHIVLPDIFEGKPFVANVRPNCYAGFKELDFLMDMGMDSNLYFDYGTEQAWIKKNPFDNVFIINNTNRDGTSFSEMADLAEFIGDGICITTGSIGKDFNDVWDNAKGQPGELIQGKVPHYSSFGISELFYDGEKLSKLCANETANRLIRAYMNRSTIDINQETDVFIDNANIREDRDQNEVLDALLTISMKAVPEVDSFRNTARKAEDIKTAYLLKIENDAETQLKESFARLMEQKCALLQEKINSALADVSGIDLASNFLTNLHGKLSAFQTMMTNEIADFDQKKKALQARYTTAKEDIDKAEKKFFGKDKAVTEALDEYNGILKNDGLCTQEIKRRQYAENFFAGMINEIKKMQNNIRKISGYFENIAEDLTKQIQITKSSGRDLRPFIVDLSQDLLNTIDPGKVDVNDFLRNCEQINRPVNGWHELQLNEIYDIILNNASNSEAAQGYLNTTLEEEFKKLTIEKQKSLIIALDKKAVPLWQYDRGKVLTTTEQYIIGVENDKTSLFATDEFNLTSTLRSKFEVKLSSTGDKYRLTLFKIESSAPAHAIMNFRRYREVYQLKNEESARYPRAAIDFHIIDGWKDLMPDLFPISENENALLYFAIANAQLFNLIKKEKSKYWIYIDENKYLKTKGFNILSESQAREQAFRDFVQNSDFIDMTSRNIDEVRQRNGDEKVKSALVEQMNFLKENSNNVTSKTMEQLSNEINVLGMFIKDGFSKV
jgi:hypothetical protein